VPASTRDGRLRAAISQIIAIANTHHCKAVIIENLDFADARQQGRERRGRRPSRGKQGRVFRALVSGIPTGKFRDRLSQMSYNAGLSVIAVDPAYTSRWGAQHWLAPLQHQHPDHAVSGHHAAAVVMGRRGLGQRARRRERCDRTPPEDEERRATNSAGPPTTAPAALSDTQDRKPVDRNARGQPHPRPKTRPAKRAPTGNQASQDHSGIPVTDNSAPADKR
jgi:hypothetical protein